ncbi:endonuclease/exonuclease/phosphatase family protein, partial [Solemya elarraichensis gill symbiont]
MPTHQRSLHILHWNARSIKNKEQEFKQFIHDMQNKPDIICIQESWLKPTKKFTFHGYSVHRLDGSQTRGEGLITIISNTLQYEQITDNITYKQHQHYRIHRGNNTNPIDIINIHNKLLSAHLRKYLHDIGNSLQQQTLIVGDFNIDLTNTQHHSQSSNTLYDFMNNFNLAKIGDSQGTRLNEQTGNYTPIDYCLASSKIATKCTWHPLQNAMSSDHLPCMVHVKIGTQIQHTESVPKFQFHKADWQTFTTECQNINTHNIAHSDIDIFNQNLTDAIIAIANTCIPKSRISGDRKQPVSWWTT